MLLNFRRQSRGCKRKQQLLSQPVLLFLFLCQFKHKHLSFSKINKQRSYLILLSSELHSISRCPNQLWKTAHTVISIPTVILLWIHNIKMQSEYDPSTRCLFTQYCTLAENNLIFYDKVTWYFIYLYFPSFLWFGSFLHEAAGKTINQHQTNDRFISVSIPMAFFF